MPKINGVFNVKYNTTTFGQLAHFKWSGYLIVKTMMPKPFGQ